MTQVLKRGALDMQVCVPADWTDEQVKEFADRENLCGTENGWFIRKAGDKALAGAPERVPCIGRACHVCATKPVDAVVNLGEWRGGMHRQCELRVTSWQTSGGPGGAVSYPPPVRYVRKATQRGVNPPALKRCKTSPD